MHTVFRGPEHTEYLGTLLPTAPRAGALPPLFPASSTLHFTALEEGGGRQPYREVTFRKSLLQPVCKGERQQKVKARHSALPGLPQEKHRNPEFLLSGYCLHSAAAPGRDPHPAPYQPAGLTGEADSQGATRRHRGHGVQTQGHRHIETVKENATGGCWGASVKETVSRIWIQSKVLCRAHSNHPWLGGI